jgi:ribonuclease P protein component
VVLHLGSALDRSTGAQVGFVVSKAVGNAVLRNRVRRRLRHLVRERLVSLPPAAVLVVRALPAAADASSVLLGRDLDTGLRRLGVPAGPATGQEGAR